VFPSFAVFFGAVFVAALSGAFFMPGEWYRRLNKPFFQPPDWLFGPAWTVLYIMIAYAGWLVWDAAGWAAGMALGLYAFQLVLNALWSAVFFGMRRIGWAAIEAAAMWLAILATIIAFWPISQLAAVLMLPYLAWVTFAFTLNVAIWRLNPQERGALRTQREAA
jgi:tryptophan-rich sensory protein